MGEDGGGGYPPSARPISTRGKKRVESCLLFVSSVLCSLSLGSFWACKGVVGPGPWLISREAECTEYPQVPPWFELELFFFLLPFPSDWNALLCSHRLLQRECIPVKNLHLLMNWDTAHAERGQLESCVSHELHPVIKIIWDIKSISTLGCRICSCNGCNFTQLRVCLPVVKLRQMNPLLLLAVSMVIVHCLHAQGLCGAKQVPCGKHALPGSCGIPSLEHHRSRA